MIEFKKDKEELEEKIRDIISEFQIKYDVQVNEIEIKNYLEYGSPYLNIKINVEL